MVLSCLSSSIYVGAYVAIFQEDFQPGCGVKAAPAIREYMANRGRDNTSIANYVWLPLRFEEPSAEHLNGMVYLDWHDEWRIEDYE